MNEIICNYSNTIIIQGAQNVPDPLNIFFLEDSGKLKTWTNTENLKKSSCQNNLITVAYIYLTNYQIIYEDKKMFKRTLTNFLIHKTYYSIKELEKDADLQLILYVV